MLLYNAIKTPDGTILHSKHRHDFIMYKDKNGKEYGVDGGSDYARRLGDFIDCEELSIYDDGKFKTRREYCCWGKSYDKDMKPLPATIWIPIKDLDTDHIESILKNCSHINPILRDTMIGELAYREMLEK